MRLGPKYLSIADKDMLKQVIAKDDFPKGPAYDRIQSKCGKVKAQLYEGI